jgi:hypothetical protein
MGFGWKSPSGPQPNGSQRGREITADELLSDRHAHLVAQMALIQNMTEGQIVTAIDQLEHVAEEQGDLVGDSARARAALILHASLGAKRRRGSEWPTPTNPLPRNGSSVPPPS